MDILFIHNNFPAQFRHIAARLAHEGEHRVFAIGSTTARSLVGVHVQRYRGPEPSPNGVHAFARRFEADCRRAECVLAACSELTKAGCDPSTIVSHCGWGESLPLRETFPRARIINYCEYYYRSDGQDVNFDPEFPRLTLTERVALQLKNATGLVSLTEGDDGISPTLWQKSTYPVELQGKIHVYHEGVDTTRFAPDPAAVFELRPGLQLTREHEVVTFVARNLEPLRGYHVFARALPELLALRPNAHVVIVGGNGTSYGAHPAAGRTWQDIFFDEVKTRLNRQRVHFVGRLPLETYLKVLQVSRAHVYLTYPFVLSWSLIEAMSTGCAIVASHTGPVEEVIDTSTGILVPFFDTQSLAFNVASLLAEPSAYEQMRINARQHAIARYEQSSCVSALRSFLLDGG